MVDNLVKKQVIQPLRKFIEKFIPLDHTSSTVTITSSGDIFQVKQSDSVTSISEGTLAQNVRSWDYKVTFKSFPTKLSLTELLLQGEYEKATQILNSDRTLVESILFEACFANNSLLCGILLDTSKLGHLAADANFKNPYGKAVLHIAAAEGFLEMCSTILSICKNVDINLKDHDGKTPLHLACMNNESKTAQLLIEKGADVDVQDLFGNTALHYAFITKNSSVIDLLLTRRANQNLINKEGKLPEDLLLPRGTNQELMNNEGKVQEDLRIKFNTGSGVSDDCYTVQSPNEMKYSVMIEEINNFFLKPYSGLRLTPNDFVPLKFLGKGSFGQVYLVRKREDGQEYAMKILAKNKVIAEQLVRYAVTERNIMSVIKHPFIVSLWYAFQSQTRLYLILDYCSGKTLKHILLANHTLPEDLARRYLSEILLALEELHKNNIIYRDLKPENVAIDSSGHIKLIDFGLSKDQVGDNDSYSFCGSVSYMAPEMLRRTGHGKAVDWYLLGIILYEMLTGRVPFFSMSNEKMFKKILESNLRVPNKCSEACQQILKALITKFPEDRLGSVNGAEDVKRHKFFDGVNWDDVLEKKVELPKPVVEDDGEGVSEDAILDKGGDELPSIQGWTFVHSEG